MKKIILILTILYSSISYTQSVPKSFSIRTINDVDSAIAILTKASKIQLYPPIATDINNEYFDQTRQEGRVGASGWGWGARTIEFHRTNYYEFITQIYVRKGWTIYIKNSVNDGDKLIFKNKAIAEETIAAFLCLIKNSGNKYYQKINADIRGDQ